MRLDVMPQESFGDCLGFSADRSRLTPILRAAKIGDNAFHAINDKEEEGHVDMDASRTSICTQQPLCIVNAGSEELSYAKNKEGCRVRRDAC